MYKMNTIAITLFIFTACSLHLVFLTDPESSRINGDPVPLPVTVINPPNNSSDIASPLEISSKNPTVSTTESPPAGDNDTTTAVPITVAPEPSPSTTTKSTPSPPTKSTAPPPTSPPTTKPTPAPTSPTTQPTSTSSTTTAAPSTSTVKPTAAPPTTPTPSHRRFDGPSFIGGIVLALGLVAIGFVAFKFYKARTELNYHTL